MRPFNVYNFVSFIERLSKNHRIFTNIVEASLTNRINTKYKKTSYFLDKIFKYFNQILN